MYDNAAGGYRAFGRLARVCLAEAADFARTVGWERSFPLSNQPSNSQDTSRFPVGLLIAGYGTACLGALLLSMLGVGILAAGLTFWLGGAVAVMFWGGVWAYSRRAILARFKRPAELPDVPRAAVSER